MDENKKLTISTNPHIKGSDNVNKIMWYVVIALLPATIAGVVFFKGRAVLVVVAAVLSAVLTEYLIQRFTKKSITIKDGSAVLTGLLLALVLSPLVPWWIAVLGSAFAIAIGKHVFGGLGHNIFNPALVGRAFLVASWPVLMTRWMLPDGVTGATPLGMLKLEGIMTGYWDLFIGNIGGTVGETSALALLIGAGFLFYKKVIDWRIPTLYIGTVFVFALIFGQDPLFHILSGGLLIGAFFMATDYVTSPITKSGKLIFGFGCGFLTIILRLFSGYPEGVMFSILLMNAASPLIDRYTRPKPFGYRKPIKEKSKEEKKTPIEKKESINKEEKEPKSIEDKKDNSIEEKKEQINEVEKQSIKKEPIKEDSIEKETKSIEKPMKEEPNPIEKKEETKKETIKEEKKDSIETKPIEIKKSIKESEKNSINEEKKIEEKKQEPKQEGVLKEEVKEKLEKEIAEEKKPEPEVDLVDKEGHKEKLDVYEQKEEPIRDDEVVKPKKDKNE